MDESKETTEPMQLPTDAPMDENEGIMTFDDWTKAQEEEEAMETELIRAAETLLGSQDDRVCTYPEGNKKRQAIYSCVTCRTDDSKPAGICYGCSIHCHDGHDLVELYTKRNFCCDCGNSKFPSKCKLYEDKIAENKRNTYNQNFFDKYCECHKPYPMEENDPDYHLEMCQCFACEDWFHREHIISGNIPQRFLDGELICRGCTATLPFVAFYHQNWEKLLSTQVAQARASSNTGRSPRSSRPSNFLVRSGATHFASAASVWRCTTICSANTLWMRRIRLILTRRGPEKPWRRSDYRREPPTTSFRGWSSTPAASKRSKSFKDLIT
ncbi:hypothetical protein L596_007992 [Steinernema carpocapsae]|uniref:UBR-type domain-containing protein n=1 Tax=Steinernema carpocapsae TaxID=34508 RepID=A0A4V6XWK6_STECR|nr:hypothetical protein L596_007992 [Steinernema carpocapsae]